MKQLRTVPRDPWLIAPRESEVVDGQHVLLRWEPAADAVRYRVQIATGSDFGDILFEQEVPAGSTALVVRRHFPEDDSLYYWRVLAGNAEDWSEGEHVETFTSGTADQVGRFIVPDEAEPFGPVAALFSTATLEAITDVLSSHRSGSERALEGRESQSEEGAEVLGVEVGMVAAFMFVVVALFVVLIAAC